MRWAVFGPTPGSARSASMSSDRFGENFTLQNGSFTPGGSCTPAMSPAIFS